MNTPVEVPLACERAPVRAATSTPEFSPLAGTGPDLESDSPGLPLTQVELDALAPEQRELIYQSV
ncbi:MAG: hypothetical protein LC642_05135 [Verrucomicrobiaceae bacterium]|nr:hypothetical protein [Verrucomicrobiaceae bacterium]